MELQSLLHVHNSLPLDYIMRQPSPLQPLASYFFEIRFNIIPLCAEIPQEVSFFKSSTEIMHI
jgi:hypothetical protein